MTIRNLRWALSACWIAVSLVIFLALDASSARSWMYLTTIALVPPVVLLALWPGARPQTIADVMHGTDGRS